jgi:YesN/AraC family two-component response regulator
LWSFAGAFAFVVMPEMSGRQVPDAILARRADTRVLFLPGYTEHSAIRQAIGSEVNFLAKPFSRETLAWKLLEIANHARGVGA